MILLPVAFLSSVFMAWTVGADSASPSFGPLVSSRVVGILRSSLIVGISAFLGAVLQGGEVTETISSGFVTGVSFGPAQATLILLVSSGLIALGIRFHYPIPTVYTLVGATMGAGIGMGGTLDVPQVVTLFLWWLAIPFVAGGIAYLFSKLLRAWVPKNPNSKRIIHPLLVIVGVYTAFTAGANHVGLAAGPLVGVTSLNVRWLLLVGGAGILLGAWTGAPKIIHAVARDYTELGPRRAIATLAGTSLLAQGASIVGIPISFIAAILGAVIGSGLAGTGESLGKEKIRRTGLSWVLTFSASFGILFLTLRFLIPYL